jgi:heat-inducible transcriptional repressor
MASHTSTRTDLREPLLTPRQAQVLSALVGAYVGEAMAVASETVAALLPVRLSPASVRNTLAELHELGLLEKPHRSAGRIPTELGLRAFVAGLPERELAPYEKRELEGRLSREGGVEGASRLLTERTRQLGFVLPPRLDGVVLRNVSFVRVSSERVLAVLVAEGGRLFRRLLDEPGRADQSELDRMATALRERVVGRTLREVRDQLLAEARALRSQADLLLERVLRAVPTGEGADELDLVVGTHLALLDQPEFRDPERIRGLLHALEEKERLVDVVTRMLESGGPRVAFGADLGEPALAHLAVVAAPFGRAQGGVGSVGVIGPSRMDYARVIPLVGYVSRLLSEARHA